MFIAIDANFRLKRRAVSSEARDPALGSGQGYFVQDDMYRKYLADTADQKDVRTVILIFGTNSHCTQISTCTGFAALMHANTKWSQGYATTGVAMGVCSRHGFILPNAVGDLQKGERSVLVDSVSLALTHTIMLQVL